MTRTAGVLNLLSGITHLFGAVFILIFGWLGDGVFSILWYGMIGTPLTPLAQPMTPEFQPNLAIPVIAVSAVSIIGGIYALRSRVWRFALIGSICGMILTWFLGLPAIIFTVMSKKKFH